jgi:hypothetical protein
LGDALEGGSEDEGVSRWLWSKERQCDLTQEKRLLHQLSETIGALRSVRGNVVAETFYIIQPAC